MVEGRGKHKKPELDRVIHEPARLQIISYLAAGGAEVPFSELSDKLGLSAGNLSVQLKRLEEAGYLSIVKSFKDNRPLTSVTLTKGGMEALKLYLLELEKMISHLKMTMSD
jgi:DNA-binding transcriptional ArsR family regulator